MKKPGLNYLFGVLISISILVVLNYWGFGLSETPTKVEKISEISSPDGEFLATTNRASNLRGWCEERMNVHKKGEAYDWEREYVFNIDCGSEVEMKWRDDKNLEVFYSYNADKAVRTSQTLISKDKSVNISYFLKQ